MYDEQCLYMVFDRDKWIGIDLGNRYFPSGLFAKFHDTIIPFMFATGGKWPQIIYFDSITSKRQMIMSNKTFYPLMLPSLQVVTSLNNLGVRSMRKIG